MKSQNSTFSRFRHGTYQIKGIDACCNMIANIFACRPPCNPGGWGQNSIYQNMVILQVKLSGMTNAGNIVANILHSDPLPDPG